jgi:predicted amidohydrolase YtcJ
VYTAADPFATAMLVDGDTVAWVGSEQAATSIADASMEVIDLHGALLAPGFVDSHVHLTETGIALDSLQLGGVRSARELLDAVAGFSVSAASAAGTVLGHGWDETQWADSALPTREQLEVVQFLNQPVEVAGAVAVSVGKAPDQHLVEDRFAVPVRIVLEARRVQLIGTLRAVVLVGV